MKNLQYAGFWIRFSAATWDFFPLPLISLLDAAVKVLSEDELLKGLRLLLKDSQRANTLGRNAGTVCIAV